MKDKDKSRNGQGGGENSGNQVFVVFLGTVKLKYEATPVKARQILEDGGATPSQEFTLESLQGRAGKAIKEFQLNDDVQLTPHDEKFFRAVPTGGGRA